MSLPDRIALYAGPKGMMSREVGGFLLGHKTPLATITDKDILAGRLADYGAAVFPGGWGPVMSKKAVERLTSYVKGGGGYIGICAGAHFARAIGLLDFKTCNVRGIGTYYIRLLARHPITRGYRLATARGRPKQPGADRVRIARVNGSFLIPGRKVKMVASYDEEGTLGAILAGRCGKGEVALFSPHPEGNVAPPPAWEWQSWQHPANLLLNAVAFVTKGRVKPTVK